MFIENVFGSKAKVKILRVLVELRMSFSLKDLVHETGLSLSVVHKSAEELAEEEVIVKIKGDGKERLYRLNQENSFASALSELFKNEKTKQRKDVIFLKTWNVLEYMVTKIKPDVEMVVLFGSQATGNASLRSDIDILVITKKKDIVGKMKHIDKKINPVTVNLDTFKSYMENKTMLYEDIKRDGVILFSTKKAKIELKNYFEDSKPLAGWSRYNG